MGHVNVKFLVLFCLAVFILVLELAAAPSPWYEVEGLGVKATEYLDRLDSNVLLHCKWTDDKCGGDQLRAMWGIILACVILSILLTALEALVLLTWSFEFCRKLKFRSSLRIPLLVCAYLAALAAFAAWLFLFWHQEAFKKSFIFDFDFVSDNSGPEAGWGLYVAASVLSLVTAIVLSASGSPDHHGYKLFR